MFLSHPTPGRGITLFALFALISSPSANASTPASGSASTMAAQTTLIDFDHDTTGKVLSVPGFFVQATPLSTLYSSLGVTFTGPGGIGNGGEILNAALGSFYVPPRSGSNYLCFNTNTVAKGPETITFAKPVSSVTIYASSPGSASFTMSGYNSAGTLISTSSGSMSVTTDSQGNYIFPWVKLSVKGSALNNISKVVLTETPVNLYNITYHYDDLSFTLGAVTGGTGSDLPTAKVSGTLQLDSIAPNAPARPFTFELRSTDGFDPITQTVQVGPSGVFSLAPVQKKAYTLHIKGNHYLAANVSIDTTGGNVGNISVFLPAGDADNDNVVSTSDFNLVAGAFGSDSSIPGSGYDENPDFNGDGKVDSADFNILVGNFGNSGDN